VSPGAQWRIWDFRRGGQSLPSNYGILKIEGFGGRPPVGGRPWPPPKSGPDMNNSHWYVIVTGAIVAYVLVARLTDTDVRADCVVASFAVRLAIFALRYSVTTLVDIFNRNTHTHVHKSKM